LTWWDLVGGKMYRPRASAPAPPPPLPPVTESDPARATPDTSNPRYVYLVTRLRTRKITIEEATELFELMNSIVRNAQSRSAPMVTPAPSPEAPRPPAGASIWNDDTLGFALLFLGAGAGLLAAGAKKMQEGRTAHDPSPPSPPSP